MLLYGGSGHAKVICGILEELNIPIRGIFDDSSKLPNLDGYGILGNYSEFQFPQEAIIISIGDNKRRKRIASKVKHAFGIAVHPNAVIDKLVNIEEGTVIMANALVNRGVSIGKHCIINSSSSIDHDCKIKNFVHIAPNATLCGGVLVGEGSIVGAGATVIPNIQIGKNVIIGAGAVIVQNIPDNALVYGNPGKIIKYQE